MTFKRSHIIGIVAFLLAIYVIVPIVISALDQQTFYFTLTSVALLSIASAGVWLTFYIGRINIGQGAFALMGGYVSAILISKAGWTFWYTLPAAGLVCAAFAILIGLPILRLRGVYFAMITLVLTEVMRLLALALPVTNGATGITSLPQPEALTVFGLTIIPDLATVDNPRQAFYFVSITLMLICFVVMWRIVNSRLGHICRSLQQNEELASSIGVNITYLRIVVYAIASFFGGVAGAGYIAITQSIYPSSFQVKDSVDFMLNCFLGGLGYVFSPMLGTLLIYFGWDLLFALKEYQLLVYSAGIIGLMLWLPNGIFSLFDRKEASR